MAEEPKPNAEGKELVSKATLSALEASRIKLLAEGNLTAAAEIMALEQFLMGKDSKIQMVMVPPMPSRSRISVQVKRAATGQIDDYGIVCESYSGKSKKIRLQIWTLMKFRRLRIKYLNTMWRFKRWRLALS